MKNNVIRNLSSVISLLAFLLLGLLICVLLIKSIQFTNYIATYARYSPIDTTIVSASTPTIQDYQQGRILSSFYGLDDTLPTIAELFICDGAGGKDGMPVVFSHQIDIKTLDPGDFQIVNGKSEVKHVHCLSLAPATDTGELRTVLLVGDFGSLDQQPLRIEIVGNILSLDGKTNFKGATAPVVPLEQGPSIVFAEVIPRSEWSNKKSAPFTFWRDDGICPAESKQKILVTWSGGISKVATIASYETIRQQYIIRTYTTNPSQKSEVNPIALIDLSDGDNNHLLCLDTDDPVLSIEFPAGYLVDPRNDINPYTSVTLW